MKEDVYPEMIELLKHLNEYRRDAVLTPVLVALEAVGELFLTLTIGASSTSFRPPARG